MNRRHAAVIALFLALALVAGAFAALRTTTLGARSQAVPAAQIAAKSRQLDRFEARLARAAKRRPPALPAAAPVAAQAPRVVYERPAPIVRVLHRHGGEGEGEHEHESEGFDD
jgi:hypothetical protein